ncbi:hypothetical protein ACGFYP_07225 [Streptomyces sp. NPDC048370]|uniref:hypothetical protein n=1 Tax=Streptomyces sp. NPDC048370 TaxID=3365540 RepID=UPI003719B3F6
MQRRNVPSRPRAPRRTPSVLRRIRRTVLSVSAAVAFVLPAAASPAAADAQAAAFRVFVNERGADRPGLEQFGAVRSTVVYDVFAFRCSASGCTSNGGPLPSQATYEAKVKEYMGSGQFGAAAGTPVVLDFEDIVVTALSGQAATHAFDLWKQLIAWTKNAAPGHPVGMYGYDWSTTNNNLTQQLHQNGLFDFFAPRMYWDVGETQSSWQTQLDQAVANDRALAPGQPIYPYIHPKTINGDYLPGNTWAFIFGQLKAKTDGLVVWEPSATTANACNWVSQNSYEMGVITATSSSGPLAASATLPSGNCTVSRGTTTNIPVTVTNTSGSTTAATQMQTFSSGGISGTWQWYNVPALAPGASFTTTLYLDVSSSQSFSTALLRIRTGISDTRWAVVVR